jgi:hypothetical protein
MNTARAAGRVDSVGDLAAIVLAVGLERLSGKVVANRQDVAASGPVEDVLDAQSARLDLSREQPDIATGSPPRRSSAPQYSRTDETSKPLACVSPYSTASSGVPGGRCSSTIRPSCASAGAISSARSRTEFVRRRRGEQGGPRARGRRAGDRAAAVARRDPSTGTLAVAWRLRPAGPDRSLSGGVSRGTRDRARNT